MPRLGRAKSKEQTRGQLLCSAREVFARSGYADAKVEEIAEQAGYSKGAFYSNFESKEAIFLELLAAHAEADADALQALIGRTGDADALVQALAERYRTLEKDVDWCLLSAEFQVQAGRNPAVAGAFAAVYRNHRVALAGVIEQVFARAGRPLPVSADRLAAALIGLFQGLALQMAADPRALPAGSAGDLLGTVLAGLLR